MQSEQELWREIERLKRILDVLHTQDSAVPAWRNLGVGTGTYASASTFTVVGDFTAYIRKGTRIKCTNSGTKYFVSATDSTFGGGNTTVTVFVNTDYVVDNAAITAIQFSYCDPPDYPGWFNFAANPQGFSVQPTNVEYRFWVIGKICHVHYSENTSGTSNSTNFTCTAPVVSSNRADYAARQIIARYLNNGTGSTVPGVVTILTNSTTITLNTDAALNGWAAASGKRAFFELEYEY